ncbi:MAG: hypothetical protein IJP23_05405 [Oscillospiraceae bacterium]|nr:hypothetical protein [Oscillospiraceae bacterium]
MKKQTKALALSGILTAVSVVFVYIAALFPPARISLLAVAGLIPAIAVIHHGLRWGLLIYAATAVLSVLLVPVKGCAAVYVLLFGHYAVLKSLFERAPTHILEWLMKLAMFNFLLTALVFGLQGMFLQMVSVGKMVYWAVYLVGNVAFVVYDIAFSMLVVTYNNRRKKK